MSEFEQQLEVMIKLCEKMLSEIAQFKKEIYDSCDKECSNKCKQVQIH